MQCQIMIKTHHKGIVRIIQNGIIQFSLALLLLLGLTSVSFAQQMGIITGGKKGTYYQFGLNLAELVKSKGIKLDVYNSNGSVENIYAVYQRPRTQLGIVQADVLAFVTKIQTDPVLKRIARKTKMVFPLYNEEIHLVGRREILNFDDLADKRVAIGKEGGGTYLTAKLLFETSGVSPRQTFTIGAGDALAELKAGNIDAMFYVVGYPVKLFTENVNADDDLAVIPILNKNIVEFYPRATIPANTYSWQTESVNTAAVKAVLVSFDFRRANCENVGRVAQILYQNMNWLKKNGHAKWNSVNVDFPLKGWKQYDCVSKYLLRARPAIRRAKPELINPVLSAIKEMLGE